ncbi:MAG: mechanosensitive ion channel family protein [Thainema sp.]
MDMTLLDRALQPDLAHFMHLSALLSPLHWLAQDGDGLRPQDIFTDITVRKIIKTVLVILLAYSLSRAAQSLTNWVSEQVARRYRLIVKQSLPFWKGLILIVITAYLINLFFDLSEENLFAVTGTIAVALGFAFKDYVTSIIAGIVALFEAPYRVGDRVRIGDSYGEVVSYGLRSIRLRTLDDNQVTIPHSKTWTDAISNANSGSLEAQVITHFYFEHGIDVEQVFQILYEAAYSSKYTQLNLPIVVVMEELAWATHFRLKAYPIDARDEIVYQTDLTRRAKQAFAEAQLQYPKTAPLTDAPE